MNKYSTQTSDIYTQNRFIFVTIKWYYDRCTYAYQRTVQYWSI